MVAIYNKENIKAKAETFVWILTNQVFGKHNILFDVIC
jgi:hypothetical protein